MTQEIQNRIEQIRRGEVPEGYKKTKVGIVPSEWEENKLSNYLAVNNDKNTDLKYTKDDVFSISGELGIVNQIELLGRSYAGASVAPYGIVYPNDVVYTKSPLKSNPYGIIKTNKLRVTGIVSTLYAVFHCKNNVSPDYVQLYFESDHNLNNYLYPIVNIGAKHDMKISDEGSLRGTVVFPPLSEQEKIVEIMQMQERLIELCEEKVKELKKLKKAFMQKMFPKPGATVPEWRFPGFTGEWEKRKFKDLYDYASEGGTPDTNNPAFYEGGKIPFVKIEDTVEKYIDSPKSYITEEGMNHSSAWLIPKDSVIFTNGATVGNVAINRLPVTTKQGIIGIIPSKKVTSEFLFYLLSSTDFKREVQSRMATGTFATIILKSLNEIPVCFPSNTNEQESISTVLSGIDNLITLHQRKCDEEKQNKKALMQLLLTGIVRIK